MADLQTRRRYRRRRIHEIAAVLRRHHVTRGMTPQKLTAIIADLGPTYIKLGQILSMRQDILPKAYCQALARLQTNVNALPFSEILGVLECAYHKSPFEIFERIEEVPLGSASIAQVHRAVLKADGAQVVIKVERPGIYDTMQEDMAILKRAARIGKTLDPKAARVIDFEAVLDEMWKSAQDEMNFKVEAGHAERFAALNQDIRYIESPHVYPDISTEHVLVMNYIPGVDIDQVKTLRLLGYDTDEIASKLCTNYLKQILTDGFFHADPHPGNIRIDGGKIAWIDMGMMGTLSARERGLLTKAMMAVALGKTEDLKAAFLALGTVNAPVDDTRLYSQIDTMLVAYATADIKAINIGRFLQQIMDICADNHVSMPEDITMLCRGIVTMESVMTTLSPDTNMVAMMSVYVKTAARENFNLLQAAERLARRTLSAADSALEIPASLNDLINLFLKGSGKVKVEVTGSEAPLAALAKMVNRIVMGIIVAALLMGSSFIATTNMKPEILGIPALGVLGFVSSFILGAWIVIAMLVQNKHLDKK